MTKHIKKLKRKIKEVIVRADSISSINFFKWDLTKDGNKEFNIDKALNDNWDKAKQYIQNLENKLGQKGIYKLTTGILNVSAVGSEIALSNSINDYNFIIITTGTLGTHSTLKQNICMPWVAQFDR